MYITLSTKIPGAGIPKYVFKPNSLAPANYKSLIRSEATPEHLPNVLTITGSLPGNRQFARPFTINIEHDEGEFVVSEPFFHIHASGSTIAEAISAFRRIFTGYLDMLSSKEEKLSKSLRDQLQYLRANIRQV